MKIGRFLALLGLVALPLFSFPADDVKPLYNREYMPALHEVLSGAQKSIHILMFTFRYYPRYPNDANSIIINDLINAAKRGVDVKLILDASDWNVSNTIKNKAVGDSLSRCGIDVYYDPRDVTSHDKLIIVDDYIVILGSHNWSYFALEKNNEASVMIKSRPFAEAYENHFQSVLRLSTKELPEKFQP